MAKNGQKKGSESGQKMTLFWSHSGRSCGPLGGPWAGLGPWGGQRADPGRSWRDLEFGLGAKKPVRTPKSGFGRQKPEKSRNGQIPGNPGISGKSGFGTKNPGLAGSWPGPAGTRIRARSGPIRAGSGPKWGRGRDPGGRPKSHFSDGK